MTKYFEDTLKERIGCKEDRIQKFIFDLLQHPLQFTDKTLYDMLTEEGQLSPNVIQEDNLNVLESNFIFEYGEIHGQCLSFTPNSVIYRNLLKRHPQMIVYARFIGGKSFDCKGHNWKGFYLNVGHLHNFATILKRFKHDTVE